MANFDPEEGYDPDEKYEGRFSCMVRCAVTKCREPRVVLGKVVLDVVPDEYGQPTMEKYLVPRFVYPTPAIFEIPLKTPSGVKKELWRSFELFWCDPGAAAGRVRAAVEILMDELKIPARFKTRRGEIRPLPLHGRIQRFAKKEAALGEALLAVKWLGNVGAHSAELQRPDLLDAFEILDHVLDELIVKRAQRIKQLAREIIKRKGPRSTQKVRSRT